MKKNLFKKSMSVFLSVLMLMSCWVFAPATHEHLTAEAIDAGDAVTAYNKELLNQIKTDPDTNMVTTAGTFHFAGNGDQSGAATTDRKNKSFANVLYSPDVTSAVGAGVSFSGVPNADNVRVWYPDTVLMYDGGTAKMGILLEADAANNKSLRAVSCWIDSGASGFKFVSNSDSVSAWKGIATDDSCFYYIMYDSGEGYCLTTDGQNTSTKWGTGNGKWTFFANHLVFNGTMSDTEWVRNVKPTWKYRGGSGDDSIYTATASHTIYLMNIQGYKRLVQDIIKKKGSLNGKEGQYTRDSLQRFVNACNKITKDLAPKNFVSTTSNNVTSWASQMNTAYTELNDAYNGLVKRNVNVGYENLFSFSDWAQSASSVAVGNGTTGEVIFENNDTVKIYKSGAGNEVTTSSSYSGNHKDTMYSIPVTGGKDYTVRYDIADTSSVSGTAQSEVFMFWYDANNNPVNNTAGSATFNNKGFGSIGACSVTFTAPASATKAEIRFDNDCPSAGSTLRFKNIAVYPAERNTAVEVDTWSTRPVTKTVQYGSTLSGQLDVPVRDGYVFNGWYIDNINVNGVKDSGEEVTDAAGNVTKSITVTNSINLYADWKPLPMDIGYDNMFSLAEWAKTGSAIVTGSGSADATMEYDVMDGTITVETNSTLSNPEAYTNYSGAGDAYRVAVEPETEYVFEADMTLEKGAKGQMFVFFYGSDGSGVTGAYWYEQSRTETVSHIGIYPTTEGTHKITFKTPANCTQIGFRVGATATGTRATYSNIGVYEKSVYDAYAKDYAAVRVPFNFGDTTNLSLVPTREGYKFDGWYTAAEGGTKIISVDGLKKSTTVYAQWIQQYTVTFKNYNGSVISTVYVTPGAAATAPTNPSRPAEKANEWTFDKWDTDFSNVQSDLTVTAVFKAKDHDLVKNYLTGATCTTGATYTQVCNTCNVTWTETFEDPDRPALGHTYERANPTYTVITIEEDPTSSTGKADTDKHTIKCNAPNCTATTQAQHNFKVDTARPGTTATCTVKGWTYTKCACHETQEIEGQTNPDNHVKTSIVGKVDATCTADGYTGDEVCDACGEIITEGKVDTKKGHTWSETDKFLKSAADCNNAAVYYEECTVCGISAENDTTNTGKTYSKGDKLGHSFTNYVDQDDATCDTEGTEIATCDRDGCNVTDSRSTGKKREHNFNTTPTVKNNGDGTHTYTYKCAYEDCTATTTETKKCTYGAWTTDNATTHSHTCTTCGYTPVAEAHDWSAWTTVGGSATEKATQTRSCTVCDRIENTDCNYTVKDYKAANCEAPEITTYECSDCKHGYSVIGEGAKGHNFTKESGVKNKGDGTHSFACANGCGEYGFGTTKNMSVPCSEWTYANTEAGKHTATCKVCTYAKVEDCTGGTATCTAQKLCEKCNTAYGEKAPHQFDGKEYFDGAVKAKDATCTEQAEYYVYCSACKTEYTTEETFAYGDLLPHTYTGNTEYLYKATDAKCGVNETYYTYCSACKKSSEAATFEKEGTALTHKFNGTTVCNNDGTHTITCSQVDCTVTETYNCADTAKLVAANAATCTEAAYYEYICLLCDYEWTVTDTEAPALGHEYTEKNYNNEAYVKVAANCDHGTIYWYGCAYCDKNAMDETDTEKYPVLFFENTNDKRAHSWKNVADEAYIATPATCTAAAKYYPSCSYEDCSAIDTSKTFSSGTALEHAFDKKVETYLATEADCVNNATYYYVCSRCDVKGTTTWEKENSKSGHSMTKTDAKAADCYGAGNYEYWYCATCKIYFKDELGTEAFANKAATVIPKRSHDIVKVAYNAPTCGVDGNPAYEYCAHEDCNHTTYPATLPEAYKATGHNFTGAYYCDTAHNYHAKYCANDNCDMVTLTDAEGNPYQVKTFGMVIDGKQVEYKVEYNELDEAVVTGAEKCSFTYEESTVDGVHSHANACVCGNNTTKVYSDEETFVEKVEPTCTAKGYDSYACKDCGETWTKNEVPFKGHTEAEKATSNGDGTHSIVCTVCNVAISTEKCSGGEATCSAKAECEVCGGEYGEATGEHTLDENAWIVASEADCYNAKKLSQVCSSCNETIYKTEGSPLEHVMSEYVNELPEGVTIEDFDATRLKAPNCAEEGFEVSYCTLCMKKYKTKNVPKDTASHVWETDENGELVWVSAGGNCATGVTMLNKCTVEGCGKTQSKVVTESHTWEVNARVEANCEVDGYIVFKCSACSFTLLFDKNYDGEPLYDENGVEYAVEEKLGHTWEREGSTGILIVDKESTCAIAGRGHYVCGDCQDESDSIEIEKKEHTLIEIEEQKATCSIDGYKSYVKCVACAYDQHLDAEWLAVEGNYTKATGHADNNEDGKCDGCKKEMVGDSTDTCGCICHKDGWFSKLIYKILHFFWKLFKIGKSCGCGTVHY